MALFKTEHILVMVIIESYIRKKIDYIRKKKLISIKQKRRILSDGAKAQMKVGGTTKST